MKRKNILLWMEENWSKSTIFLAFYLTIFLFLYVKNDNFPLFLIWIHTPIYFLHQFEEYIYPGGFMEFFNSKALGSSRSNFPLTKKEVFWINIPIIFVGFPLSAILSGSLNIALGIWTAYFSIVNAISHVGLFFKNGYNPGLGVSILLNIPVGIYTIYYFISNDIISVKMHIVGLIIALLTQAVVMIYGFFILKPKI